jgi:hypothetical protein
VGVGVRQDHRGKSCIAPDEKLRSGRRARKVHGEGGLKTKLQQRDARASKCFTSQSTPFSWGSTRTSWSPRGGLVAAEGT